MSKSQTHTSNKHKPAVLFTAFATAIVVTSGFLLYSPSSIVIAQVAGNITNSATVSGPTQDPNAANNTVSVTNPITFVSDLSITIDDTLTSTTPLTTSTYTITITNAGPSTLNSAEITQTLPGQLQNPIYNSSEGTFDPATGALTGIDLASGESITITIEAQVRPDATGTITYPVTVAVPVAVTDPNTANNTATPDATTITLVSDLSLTKVLTSPALVSGTNADYTLTVSNAGPSEATGPITVTDTLPTELTYISSTGTDWTCNAALQVVTCTNPNPLANGANSNVVITVSVN